jgi:hypothetical protein
MYVIRSIIVGLEVRQNVIYLRRNNNLCANNEKITTRATFEIKSDNFQILEMHTSVHNTHHGITVLCNY